MEIRARVFSSSIEYFFELSTRVYREISGYGAVTRFCENPVDVYWKAVEYIIFGATGDSFMQRSVEFCCRNFGSQSNSLVTQILKIPQIVKKCKINSVNIQNLIEDSK